MFSSNKPFTAVSVLVDNLTSSSFEENDVGGVPDLIDLAKIQDTGPAEAARAIRKKLKYGTTHAQLRALTLLDGVLQNTDARFQRRFLDEPFLERLSSLPREPATATSVKTKYTTLLKQWSAASKTNPGLRPLESLEIRLPRKMRMTPATSKVLQETERQAREDANPFASDDDEPASPPAEEAPSSSRTDENRRKSSAAVPAAVQSVPTTSSTENSSKSTSKSKKKSKKRAPFDLERETPKIRHAIGQSSIASTNLINSLKFVNREAGELPSTSKDVSERFEECKALRRQILAYIQLIESEKWIGSLITANEDLVTALMTWEVIEKGVEDDSDSEVEEALETIRNSGVKGAGVAPGGTRAAQGHGKGRASVSDIGQDLHGLSLSPKQPSRSGQSRAEESQEEDDEGASDVEDDDEDNPFGNHAAIKNN